jgi:glycosyltransferase involved in cell wall biosynthesis
MRVLHVVASRHRRGAEIFASSLVGALAHDGIEQRVAVVKTNGNADVGFAAPTVSLGDGGTSIPGLRLEAGVVTRLRRVSRDFRPDVIQAHGGEPLKYVAASNGIRGGRVVYRRIGDPEQFRGAGVREHVFAALLRRTARVVAVADALREDLVRRYGLDPQRVVTIPNAVDPAATRPVRTRGEVREELGVGPDMPLVLSMGALTWEKDPLGHVEVVARLAESRPLAHAFVGDGPLRGDIERAVESRGPSYRPLVLGSRDDIGDLLAAADVLLVASRTEGMPASVIEAGLAGVPVVGYALSGVPEVVLDGVTGRLVPPGGAHALSQALADLLDDPEARRSMGACARVRCAERFDIGVVAPMYRRVYEEVAAP